jgi:vacuolar-type H+-ATPase subunit H
MTDTLVDLGDMQRRSDEFGARIRHLRQRVETGIDAAQTQRRERFAALEQRHQELVAELAKAGGGKARPEHHSIIDKLAKDIDASIENFTDWVDAGERPAPPPGGFSP